MTTRRRPCDAGARRHLRLGEREAGEHVRRRRSGRAARSGGGSRCACACRGASAGTSVRASSENASSATMSPSLRLRTSVVAALRALSIFAPAIEPDVSTTRTTSMGGRLSGRASGTSTHTPRNVSRVVLERRSPSGAAPIQVPFRFAVCPAGRGPCRPRPRRRSRWQSRPRSPSRGLPRSPRRPGWGRGAGERPSHIRSEHADNQRKSAHEDNAELSHPA